MSKNTASTATATATAPKGKAKRKVSAEAKAKAAERRAAAKAKADKLKPHTAKGELKVIYRNTVKVKTLKSGLVKITGRGTKQDFCEAAKVKTPIGVAQVNILVATGAAKQNTEVHALKGAKIYDFGL